VNAAVFCVLLGFHQQLSADTLEGTLSVTDEDGNPDDTKMGEFLMDPESRIETVYKYIANYIYISTSK